MLDLLEVDDSPVELPKCVCTRNEQELEAPVWNRRNRSLRFQKLDPPVLSRLVTVRGVVGLRRGMFDPQRSHQNMFTHEMNQSWKLLLETGQTGLSDLINRMVRFHQLRRQSRVPSAPMRASFSQPSDVWPGGGNKNHDNLESCGGK
jgi:hypothetical protein